MALTKSFEELAMLEGQQELLINGFITYLESKKREGSKRKVEEPAVKIWFR